MYLSKMLNISDGRNNKYKWHHYITYNESIFYCRYIYTIVCYPHTYCWESEYDNRYPEEEECKNPRSFDDHYLCIAIPYESLYELCLAWDVEWLKKPSINFIERYHIRIYYIFFWLFKGICLRSGRKDRICRKGRKYETRNGDGKDWCAWESFSTIETILVTVCSIFLFLPV